MLNNIQAYGLNKPYASQVAQQTAQQQQVSENKEVSGDKVDLQSDSQTLKIRKFSDSVKGANEMIGALQVADISLKSMGNLLQNGASLSELDEKANKTQFKDEPLFGRELSIKLADEEVSLGLPLPSSIQGDVSAAISQKRQEISGKLGQMSELVEKASSSITPNPNNYDFENFNPNVFKGMLNS